MADAAPPIGWITVPPVAALGWIPYYFSVDDVPANKYTDTRRRAYYYIFNSGNKDPSDDLVSDQGFFQIINSHDYRGAFFLDGLQIYRDPVRFTEHNKGFRRMEYVGYTPRRYVDRSVHSPEKKTWDERPGVGGSNKEEPNPRIDLEPSHVKITQRVDFRLCKLVEVGGGIVTFNFRGAPYAWMQMEFTIYHHGEYRIEFSGSSIPSQQLYINWKKSNSCSYDMLDATHQEMERFFHAGRLLFVGKAVRAPQRANGPLVEQGKLW